MIQKYKFDNQIGIPKLKLTANSCMNQSTDHDMDSNNGNGDNNANSNEICVKNENSNENENENGNENCETMEIEMGRRENDNENENAKIVKHLKSYVVCLFVGFLIACLACLTRLAHCLIA